MDETKIIDMVQNTDGKWVVGEKTKPLPPSEPTPPQISARDRWNKAVQREQERKDSDQSEVEVDMNRQGEILATFVYTPEGQTQVAEAREVLQTITDRLAESKKPTLQHFLGVGAEPQTSDLQELNERLKAWELAKNHHVTALLQGAKMNNLEEDEYLKLVTGTNHVTPQAREQNATKLNEFGILRRNIGRAVSYQQAEGLPLSERPVHVNERELKFKNVTKNAAVTAFAKGWETVKVAATSKSTK